MSIVAHPPRRSTYYRPPLRIETAAVLLDAVLAAPVPARWTDYYAGRDRLARHCRGDLSEFERAQRELKQALRLGEGVRA